MLSLSEVVGYQSSLTDLITLTIADLVAWWRSLDTEDAAGTAEAVREFLPDLVDTYKPLSAELGAAFYDDARIEADARGAFVATPVTRTRSGLVQSTVSWAVAPLFREEPAPDLALSRLSGGSQKMVSDGARDTVAESVEQDPAKPLFARHASANACAFCRLVASRGAVYRSARSAGDGHKYHNQCVVPGTMVSGPESRIGYRRYYEGELVTLVTAMGYELSITPQHPVLTDRGWVPAGLLDVGDQVVSAARRDRNVVGGPYEDHVPARIEDVVRALGMVRTASRLRVPGAPEQFHGDGFASEVDVVATDDLLRYELNSSVAQPLAKLVLHGTAFPLSGGSLSGSRLGEQEPLMLSPLAATHSGVRAGRQRSSFVRGHRLHPNALSLALSPHREARFTEPPRDHVPADAVVLRDGQHAESLSVETGKIRRGRQPAWGRVRVPRKFDPPAFDRDSETLGVFAQLGGDLRERLAGAVHLDRLVDKRVRDYQGDVLNLETSEGWYSANGITVSNCHCVVVPVWDDKYEPAPYVAGWESAYKSAYKAVGKADTKAILAHMRQSLGAA